MVTTGIITFVVGGNPNTPSFVTVTRWVSDISLATLVAEDLSVCQFYGCELVWGSLIMGSFQASEKFIKMQVDQPPNKTP